MATHHTGETNPTPGQSVHWQWSTYAWIVAIAIIILLLLVIPGWTWHGGGADILPVENIQGEHPVLADPQAGEPQGLAPAHEEENPLAR